MGNEFPRKRPIQDEITSTRSTWSSQKIQEVVDSAVSGGAYTDEQAQDAVGGIVDSTLVYTDGTPSLGRAALTGDVTASAGSNTTVIADDAVTLAKIQNAAASSKLLGSGASGIGANYEEITLGTNLSMSGTTLNASGGGISDGDKGDITVSGSGATWTIDNGVISTAKIADNAVDGTKIALGSDAQGDIMYYDGTNWVRLGAGTSGHFLKTQGAAANPVWDASPSGGASNLVAKHKTADETVTSSAVLQDDDSLSFAIGANETWTFNLFLRVFAGAGGFKYAFTIPSGASGRLDKYSNISATGSNAIDADITTGGGDSSSLSITGTNQWQSYQPMFGYVINGANAGTVQFQWAQNTSNGTGTVVKRGAILTARKVS